MKRIGNIDGIKLYDMICSEDNIELAVQNACKDHHKDLAVIRIKENPEPYIKAVSNILKSESFHYSRFINKTIFERGKWRELSYTRTFPDRIVQHAVMQIIAPIILGTCVRDTYASQKGKGIHHGSMQIRKRTKISYIRACNRIVNALRHKITITSHMIASKISYEGMLSWCDTYRLQSKYNGKVDRVLEFGIDVI